MVSKTRMASVDFLQLPETNEITELLDGEIVMSPAPIVGHQESVGWSHRLIGDLMPNGRVLVAPTDVYLDDFNVVQPDVLWISDENDYCVLVDGKYFKGAPDLCVKVLPPGTARQDRTVKFLLYEKFGVREYWIADPATRTLEVWVLQNGEYMRQGGYTVKDTFVSIVLGQKTVSVKAIFGA